MIEIIEFHFSQPQIKTDKILKYREQILPHAGNGMNFLLDIIPKLIDRKSIRGTVEIPLYDSDCRFGKMGVQDSAIKMETNEYRIPVLQAKQASAEPENSFYQFYAARSIMEHIYPQPKTPLSWLYALEFVSQIFINQKSIPLPNENWQVVKKWLTTEFTERFMAQMAFALKNYNKKQMSHLKSVVAKIPLEVFDKNGIPEMLRLKNKSKIF